MDKILTRKNIFIVLGVIIALEVIWAVWFLVKGVQLQGQPALTTQVPLKQTAITLSSPKLEYKAGDKVTVDISITSSKKVDGVDLIIIYDPKVLTAQPAILGTIFSDYPQNSVDQTLGRVSISGITTQQGGVIPKGEFGKVTFVTKALGVTKISLDFTPGKTVDTNVIETGTGKDILGKVNELELNILP